MLGEQVGESKGKITARRVLPSDGGAKVEVSFEGSGTLLGSETFEIGTYWSVVRPDGTLYGEGQGLGMTKDGSSATWVGQGAGRFTGQGSGVSWRGAIYYQSASPKLARLNGIAVVFEHESDAAGNFTNKLWEWK